MGTWKDLQSIDVKGLQRLQSLYAQDEYCQEHFLLKTYITIVKATRNRKHLKAYTLADQRAHEQGLFLIVDRYQLFVGCLGDSLDLLEQALHLLDWSGGFWVSTMPTRYLSTVLKVIQNMNISINCQLDTNLVHLSAEQASKLTVECPEGFQLRPLTEADAPLIDREWPYNQKGSLFFIQRQIRLCPSIGLYEEQTQKLVAWCIRTQDGLLAVLQVDNYYKRRGFGSLVVKALSRKIAAMGDDVIAEIYWSNDASAGMFSKLGFNFINKCNWLITEPAEGLFAWPDGE